MGFNTSGGIFKLCEWIYRLALLNGLAIVFSLMGLGIIGLLPSLTAMYWIIRQWQNGGEPISIIREFWSAYKRYFIKSNALFFLFICIGLFLYIDFALVQNLDGILYYIVLGSSTTVLVISIGVFLHMVGLLMETEARLFDQLKTAIQITARFPFQTGWMFLSIVSFVFICFVIPGIGFLYLGSVSTFIIVSFSKYMRNKITSNQNMEHPHQITTLASEGGTTYAK